MTKEHPMSRLTSALLICITLIASSTHAADRRGPKVYISVDMEGVAGVVTSDQLLPGSFEYERFRRFMTDETLAAVRAAQHAGATDIVVSDSHGNGENLLIEAFPNDVRIVRSWPRHGLMAAGLDSSFQAVLLVGYHASTSSSTGVRAHTISSATYARVALNGQDVSEGVWVSAQAGAFGVPVVFASGDESMARELKERLGEIVTVETKQSLGFHSALTLTPQESVSRIGAGVNAALANLSKFKPYVLSTPIRLEVTFKNYMPAEVLSFLRSVERVNSHSIRFVGRDMEEVTDFMVVVGSYRPDLSP
jgi:D-amino peptidase